MKEKPMSATEKKPEHKTIHELRLDAAIAGLNRRQRRAYQANLRAGMDRDRAYREIRRR